MKSSRNKTIDFSAEEGKEFLSRCLTVSSPVRAEEIADRVVLGDAFRVMPLLPKAFVDLLIVDPPYNLNKDFNGMKFRELDDAGYREYTISWVEKVLPLLKPDATVYVCCDWRSSLAVGPVLTQYFQVRNRITWQREKGRGSRNNWKNGMEDIWYCTLGNRFCFHLDAVMMRRKVNAPYRVAGKPKDWVEAGGEKYRDTCPSNFWDDVSVPYWSMAENTGHPAQKPEKLLAKLILASSNEGDVVFDPFLGSGTAAVAARKLNRHFAGIEIDPQYCAWAEMRLEKAAGDKRIQGYSGGVFWERNTLCDQRKLSLTGTVKRR